MSDNASDADLPVPPRRAVASEAPKIVGAVRSAVRILRYLSAQNEPARLSRIARDLKLNTSTCFNILRTLARDGLVDMDRAGKTYAVGVGILDMASMVAHRVEDVRRVKPHMDALARELSVNVSFWRRVDQDALLLVGASESSEVIRIILSVGQRMSLFLGAAGRVMMAFGGYADAELRKRFAALRWDIPPDLDTYLREVEETRARGWALDDNYVRRGVQVVAVPLRDGTERVTRVLCVMMFDKQHDPEQVARRLLDLVEALRDDE